MTVSSSHSSARFVKDTNKGRVVDRPDAGFESPHEELAHRPVLAQIGRFALVEVDAENPRVEFVAGNAEPDGQFVRVDEAIQARDRPQRESADNVNLRTLKGQAELRPELRSSRNAPAMGLEPERRRRAQAPCPCRTPACTGSRRQGPRHLVRRGSATTLLAFPSISGASELFPGAKVFSTYRAPLAGEGRAPANDCRACSASSALLASPADFKVSARGCESSSMPWGRCCGFCCRDRRVVLDNKRLVPALAAAGAFQTTFGA